MGRGNYIRLKHSKQTLESIIFLVIFYLFILFLQVDVDDLIWHNQEKANWEIIPTARHPY